MLDAGKLAQNIRKYRMLSGWTQAQLAEMLSITAQNVSKWESEKAVPDVAHLASMADAFGISVDRLLGVNDCEQHGNLLLAIDGGGTKTEFVLCTQRGEVLRRVVLGGTNANSVGVDMAVCTLRSGVTTLLHDVQGVAAAYAGIAGCANKQNRNALSAALRSLCPQAVVEVAPDIMNVIAGAGCGERCIAVICGTGSVAYALDGAELHRLGGWGYLFDSAGSGYDLGREAVCAALAEGDGLGPETLITPMLVSRLGGDVWGQINRLYTMQRDEIAALAQVVFDAHDKGDAVAGRILARCFDRLAELINTAHRMYDCGDTAVLAGGLTHRRDVFDQYLPQRLDAGIALAYSDMPPIYGAAVCAARLMGGADAGFEETFRETYRKEKSE